MLEWSTLSREAPDEPDVPATRIPPRGLRLRWLGVAGFELSDDSTTILIDPFLTRPPLRPATLLRRLDPDSALIEHLLLDKPDRCRIAAVLVSHAHYDHAFDVPALLERARAVGQTPLVFGDINVAAVLGEEHEQMRTIDVSAAEKLIEGKKSVFLGRFGEFEVRAIASDHPSYDHLPGVLLDGRMRAEPQRMLAFKTHMNTTLQWLISYRGLRILFSETPVYRHVRAIGRVDIVIQGIASRLDLQNLIRAWSTLQPAYIIPCHFDDFFKPLTEMQEFDYRIGTLADFARLPQFLSAFRTWYLPQLKRRTHGSLQPPKLRMMYMLRYYALDRLLKSRDDGF